MLRLREHPLDHLLGLDAPHKDPDDHAVFGYAKAPGLQLFGRGGQLIEPGCPHVIGFHRSDDQSQAHAKGMDLEFDTESGDLVVDLEEFVEHRLQSLVAGWDSVVIALCNPDELDLASVFRPLLKELRGSLYWATGVVQASYEDQFGPRALEAVRWYREK